LSLTDKELAMKRTLLVTLLAIAVPGLALAQKDAKKPAKPAAAADTSAPAGARVKNYDFDADVIDGELVRPTGEFLPGRTFAEHGSLIKIRADFIREIVKSAEDL
jgi:hypothetical protein